MENNDLDKRSYLLGFYDAIDQSKSKNKETCVWSYENKDECDFNPFYIIKISCNNEKEFIVQFGSSIDYNFCAYCGKHIEEVSK